MAFQNTKWVCIFSLLSEKCRILFRSWWNFDVTAPIGNDFGGVTIKSPTAIERAQALNYPLQDSADGRKLLISPDGYKFFIIPEAHDANKDPVVEVNLHCSQLKESITYWNNLLQMTLVCEQNQSALLKYPKSDVLLRLTQIDDPINRAEAYGRIAFSVPKEQQGHINNVISTAKAKILTPLISLDTPGKETVQVIILADPDGHEICFVDEEGFSKLSEMEDNATESLYKYIKKDPFQKEIDVHNQTATV